MFIVVKETVKNNVIIPAYAFLRLKLHQKHFIQIWSDKLRVSANTFNGLYLGLSRSESKESKAPHKTLKEWYDRTRFKWEGEEIVKISDKTLKPVIDRADKNECAHWAGLLLKAAKSAGIVRMDASTVTLDEGNAVAYLELSGEQLYVGDIVEIIEPAWFQNNAIIEQGTCKLVKCGEE